MRTYLAVIALNLREWLVNEWRETGEFGAKRWHSDGRLPCTTEEQRNEARPLAATKSMPHSALCQWKQVWQLRDAPARKHSPFRPYEAAEILAVSGESGGLLLCVFRWHFVGCLVLQVRSSLVAIPSFDYLCSFAQLRMYLLRQCSQRARTPIAPASSRLWPQRPSTLVSGLSSGHGIGRAGRRDDS